MSIKLRGDQNRPSAQGLKNLPEGWSIRPLGEVVTRIIGGGTPSRGNPSFWAGDIPWLTVKDMRTTRPADSIDHISQIAVAESSTNIIPADTLIVATRMGLGKVIRVPYEAAINQDLKALIVPSTIEKAFLEFWFLSIASYLESIGSGTTVKGIRLEQLKGLELPIPPLSEQRRIVAEIEKQFTRLDAGVFALRRTQANLKRYRAAVLKAACEGRLVPTEAELARKKGWDLESGASLLARILTERHQIHDRAQAASTRKKKYKEPTAPTIPEGEILPAGWTWVTWDQIGISQNGRPFPSDEYQETGFKLLRPGNLHVSGKVIWTKANTRCMPQKFVDENPDLIVRGRELVMNLTAQSLKDEFLGRICITSGDEKCLLNQRLARLSPIMVLPEFVLHLLRAWRFRRYVDGLNSGSLIQHMFTSQLAEFTFPIPPLAEQTRIVAEVERRLSVVEELEAVVTANLQRATRLRQSILQQAFAGKPLS